MKIRPRNLSNQQKMESLDALYTAASAVTGRQAMKLFLRDLLTESERVMLGRRVIIARRLLAGDDYGDIETDLKVGGDTISRVQHWLRDQLPGYEQAIKGMEKEFEERKDRYENKKLWAQSYLYRLKKKYPLYFLLFPKPKLKKK